MSKILINCVILGGSFFLPESFSASSNNLWMFWQTAATRRSEFTPDYAYGDKLSRSCEYALYETSTELDRALTAMFYLANECRKRPEDLSFWNPARANPIAHLHGSES